MRKPPTDLIAAHWPYKIAEVEADYCVVDEREIVEPDYSMSLVDLVRVAFIGAWLGGCPMALLYLLLHQNFGL